MDTEELFARADKLVADMKKRDRKRFEAMRLKESFKREKLTYEELVRIEMGRVQEKIYRGILNGKYRYSDMKKSNEKFNEKMEQVIVKAKQNLA